MTAPSPPAPPAPAPPSPAAPPAGSARPRWTPALQRRFLAALLDTGCVSSAARAVGMSRTSAHRLRRRLAGTPFDRSWDGALALHALRMADPFGPDPARPRARGTPDAGS